MSVLFHRDHFEGKHILVTGATGGIGEAVVQKLLASGANVTAAGRSDEKLSRLKQTAHYHSDASRLMAVSADIGDSDGRKYLMEQAEDGFGPVYGLVNSAGITGGDTVDQIQEDDLEKVMHLNFTAAVMLSQLVYQGMKDMQGGRIVNISSLSGLRGTYGSTAYAGSKFALIGFTQSFALEAVEHNIRVNAVCPGFVDTEMAREILEKKASRNGRSYEEERREAEKGLPSGRMTRPEEVADAVLFLLSDACGNMIGESMKISGGSVMR
ncbi:SDR family NAD(P)-dependent oxidoreductase [Alkalicoccus urumqiensis]|uniref:Short-chain dehydrogenase n=1 Tax=Alkalicoccus urumqiensis TaxID=1548213 RepID=A0A2P6MKI1_ALKUR|nr:SDR family oxidoreductase [Alkalicoccus urumqiensis]PRO66773.1 short-chain dehydrogenase [Alkalicoccus urumqiensis]